MNFHVTHPSRSTKKWRISSDLKSYSTIDSQVHGLLVFFSNANRHFNTCFVPNRFSKTPAVIDVSKCKSVGAG